jgi:hypothetical protein
MVIVCFVCLRGFVKKGCCGWRSLGLLPLSLLLLLDCASAADAQVVSQRGFVDGQGTAFFEEAPNDPTQAIADLLVREEVFVKPAAWIQFAAGLDFRANSHDQVEDDWSLDYWDRTVRRPRLSMRRLSATITHGPLTVDLGKQFVRWGAADIVNPTDRFAPQDFLNVVNAEFLAVTAARGVVQLGSHAFEAVWTPRLTPSRLPLVDQRWTVVPAEAQGIPLTQSAVYPSGGQTGVRWRHIADRLEYSLSFFDGFNHLPDVAPTIQVSPQPPFQPSAIDVTSIYPPIRTYGGDLALPLRRVTVKAEAAYVTSSSTASAEYGLYVIQLEQQSGEWLFLGGYAGEAVTRAGSIASFSPERGVSRSILGRVSRNIGVNRTFAVEGAVHQDGGGAYGKAQYSQAYGQHWRATATAVVLGGRSDDFFGQYRHNSHAVVAARYSF